MQARKELDSGDDARLRYAALELRFAIEAIAYDKAQAYQKELPPKEYATWQPRKLMKVLIEIDPNADKASAISFGIEEEYGKPAKEMRFLGKEDPLTLANIKKHYDALGSYLHMPTLEQINKGIGTDNIKLRERCNTVIIIITEVLESRVFNITIGNFAEVSCSRCNAKIRRRIPLGQSKTEANCFECGAPYIVTDIGNSQVEWTRKGEHVPCPNPNLQCKEEFFLFADQIKPGTKLRCDGCGMGFRLFIGIEEVVAAPAPAE